METFRDEFLVETISTLEKGQIKLKTEQDFDQYSAEISHQFHTLKGSALTFDLHIPARIIHEIEDLLQARKENRIVHNEWVKEVLDESFTVLIKLFQQSRVHEQLIFPQELSTKISYLVEPDNDSIEVSLPIDFPSELKSQLSSAELRNLQISLLNAKNIFYIEVHLKSSTFAEDFKKLRQLISEKCEVIGTFMISTFSSETVSFRLLLTTCILDSELLPIIQSAEGTIIYEFVNEKTIVLIEKNELNNVISQSISNGKQSAKKLGKDIDFEVSLVDIELPDKHIDALSVSFLHLIRNAVDHAIESKEERMNSNKFPQGHISIECSVGKNIFRAVVKDDGRGINTRKIFNKAVAKGMVESTAQLSDEQILMLIFEPDFSTSSTVSEISGRGIGLDAVKTAINQVDGEIRVQSHLGVGTEFEIYLPLG